jgi:hypothetical protein
MLTAEASRLGPVSRSRRGLAAGRGALRAVIDGAELSQSSRAIAGRRVLAALFLGGAIAVGIENLRQGRPLGGADLFLALIGAALLGRFSARFLRDWSLVFAGIVVYAAAAKYVQELNLPVYYAPQLDADRIIAFGTVPTVWLQDHLYNGRTGVLEVFAVAMYASHFFAPVLLGFYMWLKRLNRGFVELMFAILVTSILANVVFVLFPTAPPWLAAQHGRLPGVHHILTSSLLDLKLNGVASVIGDPHRYNIVAAFPSLHAAFPVIALLVALRYGLPRWIVVVQSAQLLGVLFAIVYLGDHYLVDALAGAGVAVAGAAIVHRLLTRVPRPKSSVALPRAQPHALATIEAPSAAAASNN